VSLREEYGHFLLLGAGLLMLGMASKRKPRKMEDRSGEKCDPDEVTPMGYQCGQVRGGWELSPEPEHFAGFGPYINRESVDVALARVGFPDGNLAGFQGYMSLVYGRDLRKDGEVDGSSMHALRDAEQMLGRDEWVFPRGAQTG